MLSISGDILIRRPVGDVFDYLADERNERDFNPRLLQARKTTAGPIGVGTRFHVVMNSLGRPVPMTVTITEHDRPFRLGSVTRMPGMAIAGTLTFTPDAGRTRMHWAWSIRPRGVLRAAAPLIALIGRRQERANWARLKRVLDPPFEVAAGVHRLTVGGGPGRSNVYFLSSGAAWVLVDTGWPSDADAIRRAAAGLFGAGSRPAAILLTHSHPDHAGSARELARAWNCPVYVHPDELALAGNDLAVVRAFPSPLDRWVLLPLLGLLPERRRRALMAQSSLRGVVRPLPPGAGLPGLPDWEAVPCAGHTPGHVAYFRRRDGILLSGDALVTIDLNSPVGLLLARPRLSGPPWYTTWDRRRARMSVAALKGLRPRVIAGGHGVPFVARRTAPASPVQAPRAGVR